MMVKGNLQKDGKLFNGSGNFSNIVIESFISKFPLKMNFQIFVTETLAKCHRYLDKGSNYFRSRHFRTRSK